MFAPRKVLWYVRRRILFFVGACRVDCGASSGACRPMGRSHFSFGGERKVCKRKPAARRLREKALYCPFLKEGVRNVARSIVGRPTFTFVRARAHSFPLSKRARLFPSAAYRRSAPPQSAVGIRSPCRLGCFLVAWVFLQRKRPAWFQIHAGLFMRAMRPVAEWRSVLSNQQGSCTRPASRGTFRATAVKPRSSGMSPYTPARHRRAEAGAGL